VNRDDLEADAWGKFLAARLAENTIAALDEAKVDREDVRMKKAVRRLLIEFDKIMTDYFKLPKEVPDSGSGSP
jgi:hypothetical protein